MLIQNRIADIDMSEKVDLGRQLRHFRVNLSGFATTWDLRFDDTPWSIKITLIDQTICWADSKCDGNLHHANIGYAK